MLAPTSSGTTRYSMTSSRMNSSTPRRSGLARNGSQARSPRMRSREPPLPPPGPPPCTWMFPLDPMLHSYPIIAIYRHCPRSPAAFRHRGRLDQAFGTGSPYSRPPPASSFIRKIKRRRRVARLPRQANGELRRAPCTVFPRPSVSAAGRGGAANPFGNNCSWISGERGSGGPVRPHRDRAAAAAPLAGVRQGAVRRAQRRPETLVYFPSTLSRQQSDAFVDRIEAVLRGARPRPVGA